MILQRTYCNEHVVMYIIIESLYCTEINLMIYANYISNKCFNKKHSHIGAEFRRRSSYVHVYICLICMCYVYVMYINGI